MRFRDLGQFIKTKKTIDDSNSRQTMIFNNYRPVKFLGAGRFGKVFVVRKVKNEGPSTPTAQPPAVAPKNKTATSAAWGDALPGYDDDDTDDNDHDAVEATGGEKGSGKNQDGDLYAIKVLNIERDRREFNWTWLTVEEREQSKRDAAKLRAFIEGLEPGVVRDHMMRAEELMLDTLKKEVRAFFFACTCAYVTKRSNQLTLVNNNNNNNNRPILSFGRSGDRWPSARF